ncbi:MAG TPA: hypothetical protein PLL71_14695 [Agriterribacter sp.]|nr:hypothetical protein [Agriterribacter sp.]
MLSSIAAQVPARAARIAVSALFFSAGFCFSSWASRIPAIQQRLQLNEAGLGMVLFSLPVGLMLSLPVSGFVVARYGSRRTAIIACLLYALILPFLGLVSFVWQLVIGLFLFGFAGNLLNISMNTQGVNVEDGYGRSIMASFHGVWRVLAEPLQACLCCFFLLLLFFIFALLPFWYGALFCLYTGTCRQKIFIRAAMHRCLRNPTALC